MTKRIILSLAMIALTIAGVTSATIAYFSNTATSTGNTFSSGTMDFRIARPGGTDHRIFNVSNLKPGQTVSGYLAVVNDSTAGLDMKWKAWVSGWDSGILDDVLEVKVTIRPTEFSEYTAFTNAGYTIAGPNNYVTQDWTHIHNLQAGNTILAWNYDCTGGSGEPFKVKWAGIYKIEVKMRETAGDEYQGQFFTGALNFYATQCEAVL